MPPKRRNEFSRIDALERVLARGAPLGKEVELGIGDDAAVLNARGRLVWTIDTQVEGVHFDRRWLDLEAIGFRSFQAAVSDIAAMGARPVAALANLALPKAMKDAELQALVRGQARASRLTPCPVIGGNLAAARELSVTTTVLGAAESPLLRSGARAGHELWLIGDIGLARAGLLALSRGIRFAARSGVGRCVARWRYPKGLIAQGLLLRGRARAALDVSDGLSGDAGHLARASGVRVVLDAAALAKTLRPELEAAARVLGLDALELALHGGEDYALLAAGPAARRPRFARVIGRLERGTGVAIVDDSGERELGPAFDHFEG